MISSFILATLVALFASVGVAQDACEPDIPGSNTPAAVEPPPPVNIAPVLSGLKPTQNINHSYIPTGRPDFDRHDLSNVLPSKNASIYYSAKGAPGGMLVHNSMHFPTVVLEDVASIIIVDCTEDSVAVTFNDSLVFDKAQSEWNSRSDASLVLITNHLGDCDAELERGYFIASSVNFDNETLVATATTQTAKISTVATYTTITFGSIGVPAANIPKGKRRFDVEADPKIHLNPQISPLNNKVLYEAGPDLSVTAVKAVLSSEICISGHLAYSWLFFKLDELYFDIDMNYMADLVLTANATAQFKASTSFPFAALSYGIFLPGILELGPTLEFSLGADVGTDTAAHISTELKAYMVDGYMRVDAVRPWKGNFHGWNTQYNATADISGKVQAFFNPFIAVTVEIAAKVLTVVDLSVGLTAKPGFSNVFSFLSSSPVEVGLGGVSKVANPAACAEGFQVNTNFTFSIDAFATKWAKKNLYQASVPMKESCYRATGPSIER